MGLPGRLSLARLLVLSAALSALPLAAPAAAAQNPVPAERPRPAIQPDTFVPGRVLVGFEAGAGEQGRRTAAAAVDGRVVAGQGRTRVVELDRGADVRAVARRLADRPGVAFAEPDWVRRLDACDPEVCWHLQPRPGANVVAAHDDDHRGADRTVAVVDTGVREPIPDNPDTTGVDETNDLDLGDRVAARWRCRDNGCVAAVATPTSSHGTEVASVLAAADDDDGTTGVAPEATIVSYRVDATGGGIPISYLRNALLHIAADPAIDVVNLGLGGSQWSEAEQQAIAIVLAAGKTVVASAGNTGDRIPQYPAAFPASSRSGRPTTAARSPASPPTARSTWSPPATAWPWPWSPASTRTAAAPATASTAWPSTAAPRSRPQSSPVCSPWRRAAARWWPGWPWRPAPTRATRAAPATPSPGPMGWPTPRPSWPPTNQAPRRPWSWRRAATTRASTASGRATASSPTPTPPSSPTPSRPTREWPPTPGSASFATAEPGTAAFQEVADNPGTYRATLAADDLEPGLQLELATATVDGESTIDSVPVLVLAADDQAPGVGLVDLADDNAWWRVDRVDGDDLDDVYAVTLGKGDRLDVSITNLSPDPVAALLFDAGTTDVFGQLNQVRACGGGAEVGCSTTGLHFEADARGTYLLDVFSTGSTGDYRLTWTVRNAAGLPIAVTVPACSPNGDGVKDRCAWTAGTIAGWTITSFVTRSTSSVDRQTGGGGRTWNGQGRDPGAYVLRVLYTEAGGRALLRTFPLTLDVQRPSIARAAAAPNPFEPRPDDGDRDTTTFAMTSSERAGCGWSSTATPAPGWSGSSRAGPRPPGASGSPGPAGRRPVPGCGGPSPTSSRPPTPPATPPGRSATGCGCCSRRGVPRPAGFSFR